MWFPLAIAHIRWPVSPDIAMTDATPKRGGACRGLVSEQLAREYYRHTEHRGAYVRLDRDTLDQENLLPFSQELSDLVEATPWYVTRSRAFSREANINLQECEDPGGSVQLGQSLLDAWAPYLGHRFRCLPWCWGKGALGLFSPQWHLTPGNVLEDCGTKRLGSFQGLHL